MAPRNKIKICGIDPGLNGAFVFLDGHNFEFELMPIVDKEISFDGIKEILSRRNVSHVFLERALPFGLGAKSAFTYGRGFMAIEIAIKVTGIPVTYLEPAKWAKVMHEGIDSNLKPKAKSLIAVKRLFPNFVDNILTAKKGKMHEGIIDALLIAGFGLRNI